MTNRITGTNSGIDVDEVVKASLSTQQNKIDKAFQEQKVVEYQQEQLKTLVKQAGDFYDKYLDILSSDSLLRESAYESYSFSSTTAGDNSVTAKGYAGASVADYKVQITQLAKRAETIIKTDDIDEVKNGRISFAMDGYKEVDVDIVYDKDGVIDMSATAKALNAKLKENNIPASAKFSDISKGINVESNNTGSSAKFDITISEVTSTTTIEGDVETTKEIVTPKSTYKDIKGQNSAGQIIKGGDVYVIDSNKNNLLIDNIEFTFNSENAKNPTGSSITETTVLTGGITLKGKTETTKLKDTIVNFVNDYNKLMENINEKLWEKRDTDYMPLTDDQKKEMSDSEIEAWEKKATTGLLKNDSDLKRIQSALKTAMSASGIGLSLEAIGIKPVNNYTTKNGMFTIDESALTKALNEDPEGVKDLFTRSVGTTAAGKTDNGGVLTQLQSVLKNEIKSSSSLLSQKIGFEGTATEKNNTYLKKINNQKKLINELKEKYKTKETSLYSKYSNLEVMLEKLNSQTNSLYSMLGIS